MSKIIKVDNEYQQKILSDFFNYLAIKNFHLLTDLAEKIDPSFVTVEYRKKLINEWMTHQKACDNENVKKCQSSLSGQITGNLPIEELQVIVNKHLIFVKNIVEQLLNK